MQFFMIGFSSFSVANAAFMIGFSSNAVNHLVFKKNLIRLYNHIAHRSGTVKFTDSGSKNMQKSSAIRKPPHSARNWETLNSHAKSLLGTPAQSLRRWQLCSGSDQWWPGGSVRLSSEQSREQTSTPAQGENRGSTQELKKWKKWFHTQRWKDIQIESAWSSSKETKGSSRKHAQHPSGHEEKCCIKPHRHQEYIAEPLNHAVKGQKRLQMPNSHCKHNWLATKVHFIHIFCFCLYTMCLLSSLGERLGHRPTQTCSSKYRLSLHMFVFSLSGFDSLLFTMLLDTLCGNPVNRSRKYFGPLSLVWHISPISIIKRNDHRRKVWCQTNLPFLANLKLRWNDNFTNYYLKDMTGQENTPTDAGIYADRKYLAILHSEKGIFIVWNWVNPWYTITIHICVLRWAGKFNVAFWQPPSHGYCFSI